MKRIILSLAAAAAMSVSACQPFAPTALDQGSVPQVATKTAPVTISLGAFTPKITSSSFGVQTVPTYEITKARVEVTGPGMVTPLSETISIAAGTGSVQFNVPMGPNRVFKAFALRTDDSEVSGAVVGAVKTIEPGANEVDLSWTTTATSEVYTNMLENGNAAMAISTNVSQVQKLVNDMILWGVTVTGPLAMHPSLVDGVKIGQYMRANGGAIPAESVNYVKPWGRVSLRLNGLPTGYKFDAWVDDPASPLMLNLAGGQVQTIGPVHAGTWKLHIVTKDAAGTAANRIEQAITLVNGQVRNVTVDLAGPTTANVDFNSYDGQVFPDLGVTELDPLTEYKITIN